MIICSVGRNVFASATEHNSHLDFIFNLITSIRHDDIFTIAYDCAPSWLEEKIRDSSIFAAFFSSLSEFVVIAALARVGIKINRCVHDFAGVLDRRHDVDVGHWVDKITHRTATQKLFFYEPIDDLVDAVFKAVFVAFY